MEQHYRAHDRRKLRLKATVSCSQPATQCDVWVLNLGLGGACVEASSPLPADAELTLLIDAPNRWDAIEFRAKVAWCHTVGAGARHGVRFDTGAGASLVALVELLGDPYG